MRLQGSTTLRRCFFAAVAGISAIVAGQLLFTLNARMDQHGLRGYAAIGKVPPDIELATKSLGCFRAMAINALWLRATRLQDQGKFFELNDLFHLISRLEPRFPGVWAYWAWNVAYNCSVKFPAEKPEERWRWVQLGIEILRDRGIPENPNAHTLYRELAWIYSHKIGQDMDDAHRYYKLMLAQQIQSVLGPPPHFDRLKALANAPRSRKDLLADPSVRSLVEKLKQAGVDPFDQPLRVANKDSSLPRPVLDLLDDPGVAPAFERLENFLRADYLRRVLKLEPGGDELAIGDILDWRRWCASLVNAGKTPEPTLLKRIWNRLRPEARKVVVKGAEGKFVEPRIKAALLDEINTILRTPGVHRKEDFAIRTPPDAKRIMEMEPDQVTPDQLLILNRLALEVNYPELVAPRGLMLRLMKNYGPIDWRLPDAIAMYWTSRSIEIIGRDPFEAANSDRILFHSLVELYRRGTLYFVPPDKEQGGVWVGAPNFGFVDHIIKLHKEIVERHKDSDWAEPTREGYFNFLRDVVLQLYLHANPQKANHYLKMLIHDGGEPEMSLEDFILKRYREMMKAMTYEQAINMIHGFCFQSHFWASLGDSAQARGQENLARLLYRKYSEERGSRFQLPPFRKIWLDALKLALRSFRPFQVERLRSIYPKTIKQIETQSRKQPAPAPPQ